MIVTSQGGMYNGMLIQDLDIANVSSERRNPIIANVMAQLDYMEKRGSGLSRICNETVKKHSIDDEKKHRNKPSRLSDAEMITILIMFHIGGYKCLKHFYINYICRHCKHLFPKTVSYNRFVELEKYLLSMDSANAISPAYYQSPFQGYNSPDDDYYLIIC